MEENKDQLTSQRIMALAVKIPGNGNPWVYKMHATGKSLDEIYGLVRKSQEDSNLIYNSDDVLRRWGRWVILYYWVEEFETITENHHKLNDPYEINDEIIKKVVNNVYVVGEKILYADLLQRCELKLLSKKEEEAFRQFTYMETDKIDIGDDELKALATYVIKIPCGGDVEFFYKKLCENEVFRPLELTNK